MFCPNREKSNFSLPICLMLRITLQNASGDTLHKYQGQNDPEKCQKEWKTTSDLWRPNNGHLCGPWQNNLLQSIIIVFNSFFTSPVYIRQKCVKDSETCFCRRTRYALILIQLFACQRSSPSWVNLLFLFCCSSSAKLILSLRWIFLLPWQKYWYPMHWGLVVRAAISDNGSRITHPTHPIWWALTGPFQC